MSSDFFCTPVSGPAGPVGDPNGLLTELPDLKVAVAIAEHHIRLCRAWFLSDGMSSPAYGSYAAHEALYNAGKIIIERTQYPDPSASRAAPQHRTLMPDSAPQPKDSETGPPRS